MASATEAPGAAVSTLEILFLVGILIGLVGSIVKYFGAATDDRK
jgi:hypothetical protein